MGKGGVKGSLTWELKGGQYPSLLDLSFLIYKMGLSLSLSLPRPHTLPQKLLFLSIFSPTLPCFFPMPSSQSTKTCFYCPRSTGSLILPDYILFIFLVSVQTTSHLEIFSDLLPTTWLGWVPLLRAPTSSCIYFINCIPVCVLVGLCD